MLHIYYRLSNNEKQESRPKFYSKELCFYSLKSALSLISKDKYILNVVYDGIINESYNFLKSEKIDNVHFLNNSMSCWYTYEKSLNNKLQDIIYYVEDDYLHTKDSIKKLLEVFDTLPVASYVTLYDHPVRYMPNFVGGPDIKSDKSYLWITQTHHWRQQESTCMTFAAKVSSLRRDYKLFEKYVKNTKVPKDRDLFRSIQGLSGYEDGSNYDILIGAVPSLATHCHIPWLAPCINWNEEAEKIKKRDTKLSIFG